MAIKFEKIKITLTSKLEDNTSKNDHSHQLKLSKPRTIWRGCGSRVPNITMTVTLPYLTIGTRRCR